MSTYVAETKVQKPNMTVEIGVVLLYFGCKDLEPLIGIKFQGQRCNYVGVLDQ